MTTSAPPGGRLDLQRAQLLGTSDNSLGSIAGSSPSHRPTWVGGDQEGAGNVFGILAEHWNGRA